MVVCIMMQFFSRSLHKDVPTVLRYIFNKFFFGSIFFAVSGKINQSVFYRGKFSWQNTDWFIFSNVHTYTRELINSHAQLRIHA